MAPSFSTPPHRPNRSGFWQQSFYNLNISNLPVHSNSNSMMAVAVAWHGGSASEQTWVGIGGYGNAIWAVSWEAGAPAPYFIDKLPASMNPATSRVNWTLVFPNDSTPNPHLYFPDLRQEGVQRNPLDGSMAIVPPWVSTIDKHAVLWSESSNELMEAIQYSGISPDAMTVTTWNLASYTLPMTVGGGPAGVIAARIPIAPFAYTYQDLLDCGASGELGHMLGVAFGNYGTGVTWPARASDGELSGGPPAGSVLRLKSSYNLSALPSNTARALARTLQHRGMMIFDKNNNRPGIFAPADPLYPGDFGSSLRGAFKLSDFEIVDLGSVAGGTNSIQVSNVNPGGGSTSTGPPVAVATRTPTSGNAPVTVTFNGSGSTADTGRTIVSYHWNFGNGATSTATNPTYTYTSPGSYTVTLTVTDNIGASASTTVTVSVLFAGASGATGPVGAEPGMEATGPTGTPVQSGFSGPVGTAFTGVGATNTGFTGSVAEFPPASAVGGRRGWVLYDPTLPVSTTVPVNPYTLPTNPHTDSGSFSITKGSNYEVEGASVYRDNGGVLRISNLIHPGVDEQSTFTFEGNLYTAEEIAFLQFWVDKNHQVLLRDDLGRIFYIYFTGLNLRRTRSRNHMKHAYTLTGIMLTEIQE